MTETEARNALPHIQALATELWGDDPPFTITVTPHPDKPSVMSGEMACSVQLRYYAETRTYLTLNLWDWHNRPRDYKANVRDLCAFLECLRRILRAPYDERALMEQLNALPDIVAVDSLCMSDIEKCLRDLELPYDQNTARRILDSDEWKDGDCAGFDLGYVKQKVAHVASVLGLA